VQAFVREKTADENRASDLLKEATAKKKAKDIDGAIRCLRQAYVLLEQSPIVYPIETYLRLPLYLQRAGRFEDAQREFQELLIGVDDRVAREFVHQDVETRKGAAAMKRAGIYRAICTAHRRERKWTPVILFTLLNLACQCVGLKHQKRGEELSLMNNREAWKETTDDLLDGTKLASAGNAIVDVCLQFANECTEPALVELESQLAVLILGERLPTICLHA
jgi:tetratricopeptide (TPR) repeat protein